MTELDPRRRGRRRVVVSLSATAIATTAFLPILMRIRDRSPDTLPPRDAAAGRSRQWIGAVPAAGTRAARGQLGGG